MVFGTARDIVEHAGVPRFVFSDFPLGNPCGKPFDVAMQRRIIAMGFDLLESATAPVATVQTPFVWSDDNSWKTKVFTKERPFMEGEVHERWMKAKEKYRRLKAEGAL